MKFSYAIATILAATFVAIGSVQANTVIHVPPPAGLWGYSSYAIAANNAGNGSVHTAVGQSFLAPNDHLSVGFYLDNSAAQAPVIFTLKEGSGTNGAIVAQTTVWVPGGSKKLLAWADFTGFTLITGNAYTAFVSGLPGETPSPGQFHPVSVIVAETRDGTAYSDGRLWLDSPYNYGSTHEKLDLAFAVATVPEPQTFWLLFAGCFALPLLRTRSFGKQDCGGLT